jgi:hypothetical protein
VIGTIEAIQRELTVLSGSPTPGSSAWSGTFPPPITHLALINIASTLSGDSLTHPDR